MSSYGTDYERTIGKAAARKLIGDSRDLPRIGYSMVVRTVEETIQGNRSRLIIDNVSGQLYLRCHNQTRDRWLALFGTD